MVKNLEKFFIRALTHSFQHLKFTASLFLSWVFAVELQENCTRHAVMVGFQAGGMALALSTIAIFGGIRLSPGFGRSLSVSAKTALIVSQFIFQYFLFTSPPPFFFLIYQIKKNIKFKLIFSLLSISIHTANLTMHTFRFQVSPAFGAFFLYGELAMAECATANRHLQRTAAEAQKRKELAAKMRAQ